MPKQTLHVVFNSSAAVDLREALKQLGRDDKVVALYDDYCYGPIEPLDPVARETWIGDELGWDMEGFLPYRHEEFWSKALAEDVHRVAWTSRRSTGEHIGFLAWVARIGSASVDMVDLTDIELSEPLPSVGEPPPHYAILPIMPAWRILSERLIDRARPLTPDERTRYQKHWTQLASENAPLRVVENGSIVSAPITFFDELLMSCAIAEWRMMARVIGEALASFNDNQSHQAGDILLAARVRSLIEDGHLEAQGDPYEMRFCEVRLPPR